MDFSKLVKTAGYKIGQNSPAILTGFAVAGVVTTAVMAVKATPLVIETLSIENNQRDIGVAYGGDGEHVSYLDAAKLTWRIYLPSVLMGTATIGCIIGAHTISSRRTAAIAGAYSLADAALKEYQEKVVEQIGATQEEKIKEKIVGDHLEANPVVEDHVANSGDDGTLCFDEPSGRYFRSDIESVRRAVNDFNKELLSSVWMSMNDFYDYLNLEAIDMGDHLGWEPENLLDVKFTSKLNPKGVPVLVLSYTPIPKYYK